MRDYFTIVSFTNCCFDMNYDCIFIFSETFFYINVYFNFIICKAQLNNCIFLQPAECITRENTQRLSVVASITRAKTEASVFQVRLPGFLLYRWEGI